MAGLDTCQICGLVKPTKFAKDTGDTKWKYVCTTCAATLDETNTITIKQARNACYSI